MSASILALDIRVDMVFREAIFVTCIHISGSARLHEQGNGGLLFCQDQSTTRSTHIAIVSTCTSLSIRSL